MAFKRPSKKWVLAGLGNPGDEYRETYHNAGVLFLDYVLKHDSTDTAWREERAFRSLQIKEFLLVIPKAYMNASGPAVREALRRYHTTPRTLILAHDDADIPLGAYRLQFGRGAAGHHGVASVIAALATKNFWRIRIGTRTAGARRKKAGDFALRRLTRGNKSILYGVFPDARDATTKLIENETS